jgi:plastocyanin
MNALGKASTVISAVFAIVIACSLAFPSGSGARGAMQTATPGAFEVKIDNFSFTPAPITIAVGTTVTWTNGDDIPHTVVSTDHLFKSKALDTGDKFTFTFTKPGKYPYFCSIHPEMTGEVDVK